MLVSGRVLKPWRGLRVGFLWGLRVRGFRFRAQVYKVQVATQSILEYYWGFMGIMEKNMETTIIVYWVL